MRKRISSSRAGSCPTRYCFIARNVASADSPPPPISPSPISPLSVSTSTMVRTKRPQWQPLPWRKGASSGTVTVVARISRIRIICFCCVFVYATAMAAHVPSMTRSASGGHVRWMICGLLFFATTVNYIDRQVIGILKPVLQKEMHWRESDFGWVVFAFQMAYALMMPIAGRLIDLLGTRAGYALGVLVWSVASMSHALARNLAQFIAVRFALGIGESANFPAAIKTVADWFPKKERALATGLFNSGSNVGAIIAPLMVPVIAARFGWRTSFLFTGVLDFTWVGLWLLYFRMPAEHRGVSRQELAYIQSGGSGEPDAKIPWGEVIRLRGTWIFLVGKFLTDPAWWFYLFWIPGFLNRTYGLKLTELGAPLIAIYLAADVGSIAGGWLPAKLVARGWTVNRARKTAMLVCATAAAPGDVAAVCEGTLAGGGIDRTGGRRAPGLVGKPVHAGFRYVSRVAGGLRSRDWRIRRRHQRDAGGALDRILAGFFRELLWTAVRDRRQRVFDRFLCHPDAF